jgi:hypothetical protein
VPDFAMSCFSVFSTLWRLHESFAIVMFLIHPFHQDLDFTSAVPQEFARSGSSWFREL